MSRAKELVEVYMQVTPPDTTNREGFPAYTRSLEEQLLQVLMTNTLSNTFYATSKELLQETFEVHEQALKKDSEFFARALVYARNEGFMKLQPIVGLAKLSNVRSDLFKRVFDRVVLIPSDLQDFFTILDGLGRGQGGQAIKKTVATWLNEKLSEYWVIKYGSKSRGRGFSLGDIVRVVHPKPIGEKQSAIFAYLRGVSGVGSLPQIETYEKFKRASAEEKAKLIREGRLPHEVVTGVGDLDKDCWRALVPQLPVLALLRNLNTLSRHEVLDEVSDLITSKLTNEAVLRSTKIFPFQFLKAFQVIDSSWVRDVLRQSVEITAKNLPSIEGKAALFLDCSGSMRGDPILIGAVFAFSLFKKTNGNCVFWLFDTLVYEAEPSLLDSILSQAERIHASGGTNTGAPIELLTKKGIFVNNIIMITDEQQNEGNPFYRGLSRYRAKINKNVKCYVIDVSPYRSAVVPSSDRLTWYLYGWSDRVLHFISYTNQGFDSMVEKVREIHI